MLLLCNILFWLSIFIVVYSYILYPLVVCIKARKAKPNTLIYKPNDEELPTLSIIFAAYNEELVIEKKIDTLFATSYPQFKIEVIIGSDNSTDKTNEIILRKQNEYELLRFYNFEQRQGKAAIINALVEKATGEILVLTDANVYFTEHTLYELAKHYKNPYIALVGGLIHNTNIHKTGISYQEKMYLNLENRLKYQEGILWGNMVGAFGGIYSLRRRCYSPVPKNFITDDFFISMKVLEQGFKSILEPNALCYEDVPNKLHEEFNRKVRISIGNFQSIVEFRKLIALKRNAIGFSFFSHKIIRWITPFLLILCLISSLCLALVGITLFMYIFAMQIALFLVPILDKLLQTMHIHSKFLRFITHFYSMNVALFIGFLKYMKGVNSNVWQPTKRN